MSEGRLEGGLSLARGGISSHAHAMRSRLGFTLMEMAMALAIVGILAVFAAPQSSLFEGAAEAGAASEALFMLSGAQKAAIARERPVWVRVRPGVLEACYDPHCERPARRVSGARLRLEGPALSGNAPRDFYFDGLGRLPASEAVELRAGGRVIRVEPQTGLVRAP